MVSLVVSSVPSVLIEVMLTRSSLLKTRELSYVCRDSKHKGVELISRMISDRFWNENLLKETVAASLNTLIAMTIKANVLIRPRHVQYS